MFVHGSSLFPSLKSCTVSLFLLRFIRSSHQWSAIRPPRTLSVFRSTRQEDQLIISPAKAASHKFCRKHGSFFHIIERQHVQCHKPYAAFDRFEQGQRQRLGRRESSPISRSVDSDNYTRAHTNIQQLVMGGQVRVYLQRKNDDGKLIAERAFFMARKTNELLNPAAIKQLRGAGPHPKLLENLENLDYQNVIPSEFEARMLVEFCNGGDINELKLRFYRRKTRPVHDSIWHCFCLTDGST